ncbi:MULTISPECIES: hypothetical protein [unclassified Janthinobacterium]|uniref:hypothetical protein n=1 Tax=unclassified Janthinobacterium TaxID=2610881 RepID=UPI000890F8B4|nr:MULTISPECIES: hypothetical protein [unclassified Janthinobacterium]SDA63740.1 hypothetical protein SAMN03159349_02770 [Janthinobacterium sp. 551a]SFB17624.1 hypothetical protein SAMN03159300_102453 [Janthinobacterium sp. 344]
MRSKNTLLLTGVMCTLLAACHSTDDTAMARSTSGETYAAPAGTTPAGSTAGTTTDNSGTMSSSTSSNAGSNAANTMSSNAGNNMGNDAAQGQSSLNISSATVQSIDAVPRGMDQSSGDMQAGTSGTAGTTSGATGSMMYRVTLRLDDGTTRTFVQNTQPAFQIGDRVSVQRGVMQRY